MRIQVNSDSSLMVDTSVTSFVAGEVNRVLNRFAAKLTRVEVHLSDVNSHKPGAFDKRCVVEVRPARRQPLTVTNGAKTVKQSVAGALTKMRSSLETFFGRAGRQESAEGTAAVKRSPKELPAGKVSAVSLRRKESSAATGKSASRTEPGSGRSPKKKGIYQARRKSWPSR